MSIRIVVADDHPATLRGLVAALGDDAQLQVVGQAGDGEEALRLCLERHPDVLLLDVQMPGMDGLAVASALRGFPRPPRIVMLSGHDDVGLVRAALEGGAAGYLLKNTPDPELCAAIHGAARGERVLRGVDTGHGMEAERGVALSPQERVVLGHAATGLGNKGIARALRCGERTVARHFEDLYRKLGVHKRAEAVAVAQRAGLLAPADAGRARG